MTNKDVVFDFARRERIGLSEAVLCEGKSTSQIEKIVELNAGRSEPLLLTRLTPEAFEDLNEKHRREMDFDEISRTAIIGPCPNPTEPTAIAVVSAGSSDLAVVLEASRTLAFHGESADIVVDVGVAGLWRILERHEQLSQYRAVIVVAGMDGALFSVIGGLVSGAVIAVPTATGYGAARGGTTALHSALASCAPGIVAVNIDNGYGGACAALRVIRQARTFKTVQNGSSAGQI